MGKINYFMTGLKVLVLNIVAGGLLWLATLVLGLFGFTILGTGNVIYYILIIAVIVLAIFINGYVAQKIWKWE